MIKWLKKTTTKGPARVAIHLACFGVTTTLLEEPPSAGWPRCQSWKEGKSWSSVLIRCGQPTCFFQGVGWCLWYWDRCYGSSGLLAVLPPCTFTGVCLLSDRQDLPRAWWFWDPACRWRPFVYQIITLSLSSLNMPDGQQQGSRFPVDHRPSGKPL